jgi:hypothetical protein
MDNYFEYSPKDIEARIINDFKKKYFNIINGYSFIAISTYAWTENLVNELINILKPIFNGKIILGGYEITALSDEQLYKTYPNVDYYVKGYSEKSLEKIFMGVSKNSILNEKINDNDLTSVYLSGVIPLTTESIYWESKRGCSFHCDFCEWGNAASNKVIRLNEYRIDSEIKLFKQNKIKKINILDANFILNMNDIEILEKLLEIKDCTFNFQVNFNILKNKLLDKFVSICKYNKDRLFLELGLQTIHKEEMEVLNRNNNIEHIKYVMQIFNNLNINYEISIIFGIPGQTFETFQNTIKILEENGCKKYAAYPLRLPQNSRMKKDASKFKIKEDYSKFDSYPIKFVTESYSFDRHEWEMMFSIANKSKTSIPYKFVPIMQEITKDYIARTINKYSILNEIEENGLSDIIYEKLCKNDISNTLLLGTGADNFYTAINKILSIKSMRELCIRDKKYAKIFTDLIIDFIKKTQQHILNIEYSFINETQNLLADLLSQRKLEWELEIINKECKIFCEDIYKKIDQI